MRVSVASGISFLLAALIWPCAENIYGCPVTRIQTYVYDFIYPVHDCGIRTKVVSEDTLLFQTEMYFNPRNTHYDCQKIPLECSASR
ncbi:Oocyte-secreted protein 2 [Camelus dromedarius]|uniref:Oocyte-secreted protein 2 n=1 Tax=Camelus dromedarius TaxID=9838 RepID=A0A5N4DNZ9_CAMDR|nr:Oocyte-secreted protein 2 [Camelus dromedarius]